MSNTCMRSQYFALITSREVKRASEVIPDRRDSEQGEDSILANVAWETRFDVMPKYASDSSVHRGRLLHYSLLGDQVLTI